MMAPEGHILCTIADQERVLGFVAIDSTIGGRSCGGLRMLPDVDAEEIAGLARAMTLKFGYLGLPNGGAKAGILGEPEAPPERRQAKLSAFGRAIAPLVHSGLYSPHPDMGTENTDIRCLLEEVGRSPGPRDLRDRYSGYYTALTVMEGVREGARHIDLDLSTADVAIEGFGNVGRSLGLLLARTGVRVVAVSTSRGALYRPEGLPVDELHKLSCEIGSRFVDEYRDAERLSCAELLELPVAVLCPCARHASLREDNASCVKARLICPGANNPLTPGAENYLAGKSVLCLPDFVTNCGGVLGGTMAFAGHDRSAIEAVVTECFAPRLRRLLTAASEAGKPIRQVAEGESRERFSRMKSAAERPSISTRALAVGLDLHRRGWVPPAITARLSIPYFRRRATGACPPLANE